MTSTVQYHHSLFAQLDTRQPAPAKTSPAAATRVTPQPVTEMRVAVKPDVDLREALKPVAEKRDAPKPVAQIREAAEPAAEKREAAEQGQGVDSFAASLLAAMLRDAAEIEETVEVEEPKAERTLSRPAAEKRQQQRLRVTEEPQRSVEEQPRIPEAQAIEPEPKLFASQSQQRVPGLLARIFGALTGNRFRRTEKQLRLQETVALGEKRFVAVLEVEGRKFLIGGGSTGVSLLTALGPAQRFGEGLQPAVAFTDSVQ
jgi:hypothetical protein